MKRLLTLSFVFLPLLSFAQDDMYFTSSKKAKKLAKEVSADVRPTIETVETPVLVDYNSCNRSDDEYNRRYVYGGDSQNAGGNANYSLDARIDSLAEDDAKNSQFEMDDPEMDFRFSRRIVRFHNPHLYALASPYYWDLYYVYGAWDYLYDPYDPLYWDYGWGYGWSCGPWDCWYGSIWGWHRPYAWHYWGYGPGWIGRPVGGIAHRRNVVPRELNSSRGHLSAGSRIRTSSTGGTSLGARTSASSARSSASRTSARNSHTNAQPVRGNSNAEYTNSRSGRTATVNNREQQVKNENRSRANAAQRSSAVRRNSTQQSSRSSATQNSSRSANSRAYENSSSRSTYNSTPSFSAPSRSSSGGSMGGSRGGGGASGGSRGGGRR